MDLDDSKMTLTLNITSKNPPDSAQNFNLYILLTADEERCYRQNVNTPPPVGQNVSCSFLADTNRSFFNLSSFGYTLGPYYLKELDQITRWIVIDNTKFPWNFPYNKIEVDVGIAIQVIYSLDETAYLYIVIFGTVSIIEVLLIGFATYKYLKMKKAYNAELLNIRDLTLAFRRGSGSGVERKYSEKMSQLQRDVDKFSKDRRESSRRFPHGVADTNGNTTNLFTDKNQRSNENEPLTSLRPDTFSSRNMMSEERAGESTQIEDSSRYKPPRLKNKSQYFQKK